MARIEIGRYLAADSRVCGGRLIFRGTRILVADALEMRQAGRTPDSIAREYRNTISTDAIREAINLTRRGVIREVTTRRAA